MAKCSYCGKFNVTPASEVYCIKRNLPTACHTCQQAHGLNTYAVTPRSSQSADAILEEAYAVAEAHYEGLQWRIDAQAMIDAEYEW